MGLLVITSDVWAECYSCKRIPWEELETWKHHILELHKTKTKTSLRIFFEEYYLNFVEMFVPQIPPNSTKLLGILALRSHSALPEAHWYWVGVGA